MKDIQQEIGLDRQKLIDLALLLGSDYTEVSVLLLSFIGLTL